MLIAVLASILPARRAAATASGARHCDTNEGVRQRVPLMRYRHKAITDNGLPQAISHKSSSHRRTHASPNRTGHDPYDVTSRKSSAPSRRCAVRPRRIARGSTRCRFLRGVDIVSRQKGSSSPIVGQSGSGKSTLLHLLGLLDAPDVGEIQLDGERIDDLPLENPRRAPQPRVRVRLSVLSPAAGTESAGERAVAADDPPFRVGLLEEPQRELREQGRGDHREGRSVASAEAQAVGVVRRRNAAGGDRPGADLRGRRSCSPTSRRATSTPTPAARSWTCCAP